VEHRWGERLSVHTRVALRVQGGSRGIGYIRDVSISGALVVTSLRASPMSSVRVALAARHSKLTASIEGEVVRHTEDGFAIEWCELAPEGLRSLVHTREPATPHPEAGVASIARGAFAAR
jgi:hypothetical protein